MGVDARADADDAQAHAAELVLQRDSLEATVQVAEEQADDAQFLAAEQATRLEACARVVEISTLQRAVATGDMQVRAINRRLHAYGYKTYTDAWLACTGKAGERCARTRPSRSTAGPGTPTTALPR
jgi:hypothetical protein